MPPKALYVPPIGPPHPKFFRSSHDASKGGREGQASGDGLQARRAHHCLGRLHAQPQAPNRKALGINPTSMNPEPLIFVQKPITIIITIIITITITLLLLLSITISPNYKSVSCRASALGGNWPQRWRRLG